MTKYAIICVDDERNVLESLRNEISEAFEDNYYVELAENGPDALELFDELISSGYKVPIIISDYIMPEMKGDELLRTIHQKNSRVIKIMLTGQAEAEGIANAVNYANLYRIIMKPWNYDDLVFTLKRAMKDYLKDDLIEKQYKELQKNRELSKALKKYNYQFNTILEQNSKLFEFIVPTLLSLSTTFEKGYFTKQTKFLTESSLKIADEIDMDTSDRISLVICIILLNMVSQNFPEDMIGLDPNNMDIKIAGKFLKIFYNEIDILTTKESLNSYALLLGDLWEHHDGTGLPFRKSGKEISIVPQIIYLLYLYHSGVYKIPEEKLDKIFSSEGVYQTPTETAQRHSATIKYLIKSSSFFDTDIFSTFLRLVRSKKIQSLTPDKNLIKIVFQGEDFKVNRYSVGEFSYDENMKIVVPVEKLLEEERKAKEKTQAEAKKSLQSQLSLSDVRVGMIMGDNVMTKFGRVVLTRDTLIEKDHIDELNNLIRNGLLSDVVKYKIFIPREV